MFVTKASAALAAALFCLASPALAGTTAPKADKALLQRIKPSSVANTMKGLVFSFFIDYSTVGNGDLEVLSEEGQFKMALYEKPIYDSAAGTSTIGNALYNIQIFEDTLNPTGPGSAEGNYQSVQSIPVVDKKGDIKDVYININGRVAYTLAPNEDYPIATNAQILSIAVSSLETEGIACTNVGISALNVEGSRLTQYVIDTRKATCVKQTIDE